MSKLKRTALFSIVVSILTTFVGCTQRDRYEHFAKEDQLLSWAEKREKSFGNSDYSQIETEDETFTLLEQKYHLGIPAYYQETKTWLTQIMPSKTIKPGKNKYSIFARDKSLEFRTIYPFYEEKELKVIVEVKLGYEYSIDRKQAFLQSQIIKIQIAQVKGKLPNDNLVEVIQGLGKNMKISQQTIDSRIAGYEKRVRETNVPITEDYLPIITNAPTFNKETEFLKEIAVVYDQEGTLREIYAEISEQI